MLPNPRRTPLFLMAPLALGACQVRMPLEAAMEIACASPSDCPAALVCVADVGRCAERSDECIEPRSDGTYQSRRQGAECALENDSAGICNHAQCVRSLCGDGLFDPVVAGEQCDDGAANSDTEPNACRSNCLLAHCGDGVVDDGEACDDGQSNADGNACSPDCTNHCGDGYVQPDEECDDGNAVEGDGCDSNCTVSRCGNGIVDPTEQCDDGNQQDGDGCSVCEIETGWLCLIPAQPCTPVCGDGFVRGNEECDDANQMPDDGCTQCAVDPGYACSSEPSQCLRTWYVDASASPGGDGLTWETAYEDLHDALSQLDSVVQQVWIARGIYSPGPARTDTFVITEGARIYGGFTGNERQVEQRDLSLGLSVLDGDVLGDDTADFGNRDDNNCHIVTLDGPDVILDGLHVRSGAATSGCPLHVSAGIRMGNDVPPRFDVHHSVFSEHISASTGSVFRTSYVNQLARFFGVIFENNGATAVDTRSGTLAEFYDCTFRNNSDLDGEGGGAIRTGGHLQVMRSVFVDNLSTTQGGAIRISTISPATTPVAASYVVIANSLFSGNVASQGGAIAVIGSSTATNRTAPLLMNLTVMQNEGGGIYAGFGCGGPLTCDAITTQPYIVNSIVWGNDGPEIEDAPPGNGTSAQSLVWNSCIEGGWAGGGGNNIDLDPEMDEHFVPSSASPVLDVGTDDPDITEWSTVDLLGNARVVNYTGLPEAVVDMGAVERQLP